MTTATPKEGELMYSGMTWGERYVKMDGDKMDVYKKQADAAPHFSVGPLSECIVAGDATKHPMGLPAGTAFIVQVGKKKHIFYCMTDYEKRQWIAAIEHNIVMGTLSGVVRGSAHTVVAASRARSRGGGQTAGKGVGWHAGPCVPAQALIRAAVWGIGWDKAGIQKPASHPGCMP